MRPADLPRQRRSAFVCLFAAHLLAKQTADLVKISFLEESLTG